MRHSKSRRKARDSWRQCGSQSGLQDGTGWVPRESCDAFLARSYLSRKCLRLRNFEPDRRPMVLQQHNTSSRNDIREIGEMAGGASKSVEVLYARPSTRDRELCHYVQTCRSIRHTLAVRQSVALGVEHLGWIQYPKLGVVGCRMCSVGDKNSSDSTRRL